MSREVRVYATAGPCNHSMSTAALRREGHRTRQHQGSQPLRFAGA
jgi:hypothetical protein